MIIDILIVLVLISAAFRGREIGFVQQLFSTIGFFGGLFLGAKLQTYTVDLASDQLTRFIITIITTLGLAFLLLVTGETVGIILKRRLRVGQFINRVDNEFGAVLSVISVLIAAWLLIAVMQSLPYPGIQQAIRDSHIATTINRRFPYAPNIIAGVGHLIDPNGFPQVFAGGEPNPPAHINIPSTSQLLAAVNKDRASVVKVTGEGCGGIVDGSGFVVGDDMVVTNAHVVAGISHEYVIDSNGNHSATAIWFDPDLDVAVLRVPNLAGDPLQLSTSIVGTGTPAVVLGYPGGGGFTANAASVLEHLTAIGRNIYGKGSTERSVYEIGADVEPGNSGGPLVSADGRVIGVIFARSTSYNRVGYALTTGQVVNAVNQASAQDHVVTTGSCTAE
jgi:S1-C subfamily serine protease